jgi:acyl-coenzyme A thioesterase PaaI-like protein
MDMHYLAPVRNGQLVAEGRIKKMGGRIAFSEVDVADEKKKTVAMGRFTIVIVKGGKREGKKDEI